ncbi:hypothetical protein Pla52o_46720 [Novipirellula galeiformis]|uniref:Uncharacterized protein n=1 Tax=Novipirellula galeiformis TaxID=2528004 RepID=A0A5C6C7M7_9BACT|nr:hypothetical protein [Novipirellula galeiformis]TWU20158.1 hypothetical protein Pla52o_46720 [Novipirellula galeiformis]
MGTDLHCVVIRDDSKPAPDMAMFELSTFTEIQFDSPDSYWIITAIGGFTEYFRRVPVTGI